jgi:hypothetical protein
MMGTWPRYTLTVEIRPPKLRPDMPEPAPPMLRLRAALKVLLRSFGVVCREIRELPAGDGAEEKTA